MGAVSPSCRYKFLPMEALVYLAFLKYVIFETFSIFLVGAAIADCFTRNDIECSANIQKVDLFK